MANVLATLAGIASPLAPAELAFIPKGNIGGISVQATLEEQYTDSLEVTEHPVEAGAQIADHSFVRPQQLVMRCGWSDASPAGLLTVANNLFTDVLTGVISNAPAASGVTGSDYVSLVYAQLLNLQQSRQPFTVQSTARQYTSMLLTSLELTRDAKTSQALMVTATMRQVILATTQVATLPPQANQANPASTAQTQNTGSVAPLMPITAPPAGNGGVGALPMSSWESLAP